MTKLKILVAMFVVNLTVLMTFNLAQTKAEANVPLVTCSEYIMQLPGQSEVCELSMNLCTVQYDTENCHAYFWSGNEIIIGG